MPRRVTEPTPTPNTWRTGGIGPERTGAGLRGIGLIAIVVAFLAGSSSFLANGDDDDPAPSTGGEGRTATVLAPLALRAILPRIAPETTYVFGTDADLRRRVEAEDPSDLLITASPSDAQALARAGQCTDAVVVATRSSARFVACVPTHDAVDSAAGVAYLRSITTVEARAALLEAGFDVPDR